MTQKEQKDQLKKKLRLYRDIKAERDQITAQIEALAGPKAVNLDGMPKAPGTGDAMVSIVEKRDALRERYREKLAELTAAQTEIEDLIETLDPKARKLMRHRYIEGLSWEAVCVAMCYSWSQTHDIHSKALDKLVAAEMEKTEGGTTEQCD